MRRHIIDSINTPPISQEKWKLKHWSWTWIEVKEWWKWSHLYSYKIPYMLCFLRKIYTSLQLDLQKKLLHQRKWFKNSPQVTEKNKCWRLFFFWFDMNNYHIGLREILFLCYNKFRVTIYFTTNSTIIDVISNISYLWWTINWY